MVKQTLSSTRVNWLLWPTEEKQPLWRFFPLSSLLSAAGAFVSSQHVKHLSKSGMIKTEQTQVNTGNFEKFSPRNTSLTLTIRPADLFPSTTSTTSFPSTPPPSFHFLFRFYFLFSHGCRIQSSTPVCRSIQPNTKAAGRSSVDQRKACLSQKNTEKEPSCSRSLSMVIEFLNIFSKSA